MSDYAIRDARTGEYVVAAYRHTERPCVFTQPDGALMYATEQEAEEAMREFGLGDCYEVVRL